MTIELGEHTIVSQHKPSIEVKIQNVIVKKLEFTLRLGFVLKGFNLKIKNGVIREMQTGAALLREQSSMKNLLLRKRNCRLSLCQDQ